MHMHIFIALFARQRSPQTHRQPEYECLQHGSCRYGLETITSIIIRVMTTSLTLD